MINFKDMIDTTLIQCVSVSNCSLRVEQIYTIA